MAAAHSAAPLRALGLAAASALLPACAEKLASCELSPTYTRPDTGIRGSPAHFSGGDKSTQTQ
eukprot:8706227-Pyramimonas_sp.AAC.1